MIRAFLIVLLACAAIAGALAQNFSIRFYGQGVNAPDADRVKIDIDDPATNLPGPPVDVGSEDFTIEFWMKGDLSNNTSSVISCGFNNLWIDGNIIIDRDRFNQGRNYGISIGGGFLVFGTMAADQTAQTICSSTSVLDGNWHHVALQRRRSDGWMWLYVDGNEEADAGGPDGDISYPDDGVPQNFCGGPCVNSDPFIVLGAKKHDAGAQFPSYNGFMDSNVLRYSDDFTPPSAPFVDDAQTVGLYPLENGSGAAAFQTGSSGSPNGAINFGGSPTGPEWSTDTPFTILALEDEKDIDTAQSLFNFCVIARFRLVITYRFQAATEIKSQQHMLSI